MLGSKGSGDLYFIEFSDDAMGLRGQQYFVFSKFGLSNQNHSIFKVLSELNKRGELTAPQLEKFFKPLADALVAQQARISAMKSRMDPQM